MLLFNRPVVPHSVIPRTVVCQASLSLTISRSLPKFMFIVSVMPSSHLILWCPLLLLPSIFPASGTSVSHLCTSDDQNTRAAASASVLPVNIQRWSPLTLTGLISLLCKRLSGVFSSTTVQRYQFFGVLPSLWSMKLWAMPSRATQDGWVTAESSDKMWSTGGGNGKPLQYTCH